MRLDPFASIRLVDIFEDDEGDTGGDSGIGDICGCDESGEFGGVVNGDEDGGFIVRDLVFRARMLNICM